MKYESFIKIHYRRVYDVLKKASTYTGTINVLPELPLFLQHLDFCHIVEDNKSDFMSGYMLNENAPIELFENWFDFYAMSFPHLAKVILPTSYLKVIYNGLANTDDESVLIIMNRLLEKGIEELVNEGVLVYGN